MSPKSRKRAGSVTVEVPKAEEEHHITDPFLPQTPLGTATPERTFSPRPAAPKRSIFIRWIIDPSASFKLLLLPFVLYFNWQLLSPYVGPGVPNPFGRVFILSGYLPGSKPDDPRYRKTYWDILFLAYYVIFFSFVRQALVMKISRPIAKYFGLKREGKLDRFGEQFYAWIYFAFFGAWGCRIMASLPTYWYNTSEFWRGYPEWEMKPEMKRYYLMQFSYWLQQLLVMVLGLEKPRKDFKELVGHHIVTLWLIGWSYLVNCTYMGNAVFMSMDIPDTFFAFSKLLNYIQWNTLKIYSFGVFFVVWTYFRHYLNLVMIWSVWFEQPTIPEWTKKWSWSEGVYMPYWMRYQIFIPMVLLQVLNLVWYSLIVKILIRAIMTNEADDDRSDDEDDGQADALHEKEN